MSTTKLLPTLVFGLLLAGCDASTPESKAQAKVTTDKAASALHCDHLNLDILIGFDETEKKAQCKSLKDFNLVGFKCEVSENAFGAEIDAIHIETTDQSIFAYSNSNDCNQAFEIYKGNGP